jgi:hypothetical protein
MNMLTSVRPRSVTLGVVTRSLKTLLILYFTIGLLVYLVIASFAGGLGIIGFDGPGGEALEFIITVLA